MKEFVFEYLSSKLEFKNKRFEIKDPKDFETNMELILGGVQGVIHSHFELSSKEEVQFSHEWCWKNLPKEHVENIKKKDSVLYRYLVKNYGQVF